MPIYEYHCTSCDKDFEVLQKVGDKPSAKCPLCKKAAKRVISQTSFMLKGGGWYKDGYSKSGSGGKKSSTERKPTSDTTKATTDSKKTSTPKSDT